jgi:Tol biopolymer transport system component
MKTLGQWTCGIAVMIASSSGAQVTQLVSVSPTGGTGNGSSGPYSWLAVSSEGRYVAFYSSSSNLVPMDTNGVWDVFVRDRRSSVTELVSVSSAGVQGNGPSDTSLCHGVGLSITPDGRYIAFESRATNLVPGDINGKRDVFVRDCLTNTTQRVSVDSNGVESDGESFLPGRCSISADGRYVAFASFATNLVPGDSNRMWDVFVRDVQNGTTERVNVGWNGAESDLVSGFFGTSISSDGRFVAFASNSTNLVPGDTNNVADVFVRDRRLGLTERVSVWTGGGEATDDSKSPSISADGRYVAFESQAWDWNDQVLVRDRVAGTTEVVSVNSLDRYGDQDSFDPSISADGRFVVFQSDATNLVPGGTQGIYLRDRQLGTTEQVDLGFDGGAPNGFANAAAVSSDGRYVAFQSNASNLLPGASSGSWQAYVHDREHGGFATLCDPGIAGVGGCPCSNPPSGSDRGCDNSSSTGGVGLDAWGGEYLSSDSIVFSTRGRTLTP